MKRTLIATFVALSAMIGPAFAQSQIVIEDAYARAAGMNAMAGAAFFQIVNSGDEDDRLVAAKSTIAQRTELHTHIEGEGGVMRMVEVEEGFPVAAGETHALQRGGDHVMFMGLNGPWTHGDTLSVTLVFEAAGEIEVEIPVDLERQPNMGKMGHGNGTKNATN